MHSVISQAVQQVGQVIFGKSHQICLAFACLLAKGHLLIEDRPGMGKTTLSHSIAKVLALEFNRIQFTSDLLPADILGVSIYDRDKASFTFHPGPIFSEVVLIDEINRATPKTQSALLEAMEERQVTTEGETRILPAPFFVIATQNPLYQIGTFPLPESQLDRFLMCIQLGYPSYEDERSLLQGTDRREFIKKLPSCMTRAQLQNFQAAILQVKASHALLDYLQALVHYTRTSLDFEYGLSPRGALALLHSAQAWAFLEGRDHVMPEDIQIVFGPVVAHRLRQRDDHEKYSSEQLTERILSSVSVV